MRNALALSLPLLVAGCTCPFAKPVQQRHMRPEQGTYQSPEGTLGTMPATAWTETTVDAAVPNKQGVKMPLQGEILTLTGEIIDVSCYLQLGKHGKDHKDCAVKCAKNGNPIGLLTEDGLLWILMAEEHHPRRDGKTGNLREALIERMADVIKVTGTASRINGTRALFVHGFAK